MYTKECSQQTFEKIKIEIVQNAVLIHVVLYQRKPNNQSEIDYQYFEKARDINNLSKVDIDDIDEKYLYNINWW